MNLRWHVVFDPATFTLTYVVWDVISHDALVIDPVLDFDPATKRVSYGSALRLMNFVERKNLRVHWILDTHAHADHLSASNYLRTQWLGSHWGMGARIREVFATFKKTFQWPADLALEKLGLDRFFQDGEEFTAGTIRVKAINTPGHTPACVTFQIEDWLFTGDAMMMPDSGVGRCDFPGGSASALYDSIMNKLYVFPDHFLVFTGHDYQPGGRVIRFQCTLGEQKRANIHLPLSKAKTEFVHFRESRDKTLSAPRLLQPSLDWNLGAHELVAKTY